MNHALMKFKVLHQRVTPKKYKFVHDFFWFKVDLDEIEKWPTKFVSVNKFNIYSFLDSDHIKLGKTSARENYIQFAKENGLDKEIQNVSLYTQLRFLGYVFNPVSFVLLTDTDGKQYSIIEIGNTFNEQKPYWVGNESFNQEGFQYRTKKYFYISPFIDHDNEMDFTYSRDDNKVKIGIDDFKGNDLVLRVRFDGQEIPATTKNLIKMTLFFPFVTLKIIFLIHFHAFILWMKGIKYFKKHEDQHLQQGTLLWKTSKHK